MKLEIIQTAENPHVLVERQAYIPIAWSLSVLQVKLETIQIVEDRHALLEQLVLIQIASSLSVHLARQAHILIAWNLNVLQVYKLLYTFSFNLLIYLKTVVYDNNFIVQ